MQNGLHLPCGPMHHHAASDVAAIASAQYNAGLSLSLINVPGPTTFITAMSVANNQNGELAVIMPSDFSPLKNRRNTLEKSKSFETHTH